MFESSKATIWGFAYKSKVGIGASQLEVRVDKQCVGVFTAGFLELKTGAVEWNHIIVDAYIRLAF